MSTESKKLLTETLSAIVDIAMISGTITGNEITESVKDVLTSVEAANKTILEVAPPEIAIAMVYGETKGNA